MAGLPRTSSITSLRKDFPQDRGDIDLPNLDALWPAQMCSENAKYSRGVGRKYQKVDIVSASHASKLGPRRAK